MSVYREEMAVKLRFLAPNASMAVACEIRDAVAEIDQCIASMVDVRQKHCMEDFENALDRLTSANAQLTVIATALGPLQPSHILG